MRPRPFASFLAGLRCRLAFWVLLALLPSLALAFHAAHESRRNTSLHLQQESLRLARTVAFEKEALFTSTKQLLAGLAQMDPMLKDMTACRRLFGALVEQSPYYNWMAVVDPAGQPLCGAPLTETDLSDESWFRQAVASRRFTLANTQLATVEGREIAVAALPVEDEEMRLRYVLVASIDVRWLGEHTTAGGVRAASITLIDEQGVVLARQPSDRRWLGRNIASHPVGRAVLSRGEGTLELPGLVGDIRAVGFTRLPNTRIYVVVASPIDSVLDTAGGLFLRSLGWLGLFTVLTLALALIGGQRLLIRPIARLAETARELSRGNLDARTGLLHGPDEMGHLAHSFDNMAERVEQLVTERTRDLAAARAAAERADREKSRFLAAASHDLRQPLQAMSLYMHLLQGRLTTDEQRSLAAQVTDSAEATRRLFDTLMGLSALEAGALQPNVRPVALAPLLRRIAEESEPEAAAKTLRIRTRLCEGEAMTDPVLLERMVRNLVKNALRYTDAGGILLACRRRGDGWRIEIWDTGPGIAQDRLEAIFEDFYRIEGGKDREPGLGLGLSTVARMGRLLGHATGVNSRPGRGSVFHITIGPSASVKVLKQVS